MTETAQASSSEAQALAPVFFDSTRPTRIPAGSSVAAYADGAYAWPSSALRRFARARWITIGRLWSACGIADYEPGNPVYEQPGWLRDFAFGRLDHGWRARIYCDRFDAAAALERLGELAADDRVLWWIATLDNMAWTAAELAADLAASWHAPIPAARIWACQNTPGPGWDRSILYGEW